MEERTCSVYSSAGSESGMHLAKMKADHSIESSAHKVPFDLGVVQAMISHKPVARANRNVDSPGALDFLWIFSGFSLAGLIPLDYRQAWRWISAGAGIVVGLFRQ